MGIELVPLQSPYCMPFNSGGKGKVPATRLGGCQFSGPERDWWSNYPNVFQGAWKTLLGLVEANNFLDAINVINPTLYLQSNIRGKNLRPPPAWGFDYFISSGTPCAAISVALPILKLCVLKCPWWLMVESAFCRTELNWYRVSGLESAWMKKGAVGAEWGRMLL